LIAVEKLSHVKAYRKSAIKSQVEDGFNAGSMKRVVEGNIHSTTKNRLGLFVNSDVALPFKKNTYDNLDRVHLWIRLVF
jgi:hypothetical protein